MKQSSRIILAIDELDEKKVLKVAKEVGSIVDAIKINYPTILCCGLDIVKKLRKYSDIICDLKVADVPHVNKLIVSQAINAGAAGIICHGFVGRDSVEACIEASGGKDVFVVTEMSHPGGATFLQVTAEQIAKMAVEVGASGVVAPATRPERIKRIREIVGKLKIISPGVGAQGGDPKETIKAGADYIIVGRSIYESENPRKEVERIAESIR
ncbi:MAG: orotidine-5'-phosphate decarboxylase [Thermoplasmata archaeon]